ncbi:DNA mismatch endonuclease (patch repair protein) [Variovorax sp. GrIS 2.14]|uniref:very short patch repair endonuclease n=1 Tax=Variovorax sp. GrIS 2.14 TaxID=3071709 RepID=UPI0038F7625F
MDVVDAATRSRMMAGIKGRDTKIELVLRKALHAQGLRYRLHNRKLPGRPDLSFPGVRAVVFVNGCFWHGHDCPLFRLPRTNAEFWKTKIDANRARDSRSLQALTELGWRSAVVWECAMRGRPPTDLAELAVNVGNWVRTGTDDCEFRGSERVIPAPGVPQRKP